MSQHNYYHCECDEAYCEGWTGENKRQQIDKDTYDLTYEDENVLRCSKRKGVKRIMQVQRLDKPE